MTCGVWGDLFTLVLGKRAQGLNFEATATLHRSHAYFNASLLGNIFGRMGLPAESLEFLTRGAKFSKPPLKSTLQNIPGLLRLLGRELSLAYDFRQDLGDYFEPTFAHLAQTPASTLSVPDLFSRVQLLLVTLRRATYYSILVPLSVAIRQAILKVADTELDTSQLPEVAALRSLQELAQATRHLFPKAELELLSSQGTLFARLAEHSDGEAVLDRFQRWLEQYGYLSEVGTDIAVPTWQEERRPLRSLFAQMLLAPEAPSSQSVNPKWVSQWVQGRLNLKGQVATVYSRLLAELRWTFIALEQHWLSQALLQQPGDIFFLELEEVWQLGEPDWAIAPLQAVIEQRRSQWIEDRQLSAVPTVVYGRTPPISPPQHQRSGQQLRGIGASPGTIEGVVKIIKDWQTLATPIDRSTILVVPYTDAGWAPLLARAGGIIAEVGGRLSHGAIVAREYGIPAVMDIPHATQQLHEGQRVWLDGQQGIIEVLEN
jgi:pyruvate,water dikinase